MVALQSAKLVPRVQLVKVVKELALNAKPVSAQTRILLTVSRVPKALTIVK
jgi:hypothetical protein